MSSATKAPPATTSDTSPDATLELIDRSLIDIDADFNPRSTMDQTQLMELTESVRQVGVLQPVTLVRSDERYRLVIGHRRFAAATIAKLDRVPALVYASLDEASRLQLAIIENVQREDMNPIDEALAFQRAIKDGSLTQKQLASVIGKSASHVSERLRLLKLPPTCRELIASGALPLVAAKPLTAIATAKVPTAALIADACAKLIANDDIDLEIDEFLDDPTTALYVLASDEAPTGSPFLYRIGGFSQELRVEGHADPELIKRITERASHHGYTRYTATSDDTDAARAYGCLIEIESRYSTQRFITDAAFILDRINDALDRTAARQAERTGAAASDTPSGPGTSSSTASTTAPPVEDDARARAALREQAEKDRVAAIHANRELGVRLQKQLGSHKLDRPAVELLAHLVLAQNPDLAARGIAYTHEGHHTFTQKRQKNGKTRTTIELLAPHESSTRAAEWVLRPRSAEEVLGRLLQLLVAGVFADERSVAKSRRTHWHIRANRATEPIIAKLARKLLPEHFHAHADQLLPAPKTKSTKADSSGPAKKSARPAKPQDKSS